MTAQKLKIGCCGFPVAKSKYFGAFGVVELQQTFYQPPGDLLIDKWRRTSPGGFEYTMKAWQLITHEPSSPTYRKLKMTIPSSKEKNYGSFKPTDEVFSAWKRSKEVADILGAKIIVFQCPPSFGPTTEHKKNLNAFFSSIERQNFILGWEPRGAWGEKDIAPLCRALDLVHVVDPFNGASTFGKIRYYRLHGIGGYRYKYTHEDLSKLIKITESGMDTYVLFNNVYMFENALAFKSLMKEV